MSTSTDFSKHCVTALKAAKDKTHNWGWDAVEKTIAEFFTKWQNERETKKRFGAKEIDEDWLKELEAMPCYAGIDVRRELGKMQAWACTNRQQPSRRRFINWLNKVERPIHVNGAGQTSHAVKKRFDRYYPPVDWKEQAVKMSRGMVCEERVDATTVFNDLPLPLQEMILKDANKF